MRRIYIFAWTILISCGIVIYNQIDFNSRNSENNTQNTSSADVPQTSEIDLPQIEKAIASESEVPDPVSIKIESIDLFAPIIRVGLDKNKSLIVPNNPQQVGWYSTGPKPGSVGTALIDGHYDSAAGPGVFYNLRKIVAGQEIEIVRNDGTVAVFKVDQIKNYAQDSSFPWSEVYNKTDDSSIRIITCHGNYNKITKRYSENLVVFASLSRIVSKDNYDPL